MPTQEEAPLPLASGRLDSWKEIADYLGKGVTTVRRWEKEEGLPVRRQEHLKRGSVVAYKKDLDTWRDARTTALPEEPEPVAPNRPFRAGLWIWGGVAIVVAGLLVVAKTETAYVRTGGHVLTSYRGRESHQTFEPDGERVAFAKEFKVWVKRMGEEPSQMIWKSELDHACCVRWSPDGRRIAFSYVTPQGAWEYAVMDPDGRNYKLLGSGGPEIAWRNDSRAVLIAKAESPGGPAATFEHDVDSNTVKQISFPPAGSWGDIMAKQSPDGKQLVVARYPIFAKGDVYVTEYGQRTARRVTSIENWVVGVDWMPDGNGVVFGGDYRGKAGINYIGVQGQLEPELIAGTEGVNRYPETVRLRDGTVRLGFTGETWNTQVKRVNPRTGQAEFIAESSRADEQAHIAHDGRVVFVSNRTGGHELWICERGGRAPRRVTFDDMPSGEIHPRWSPDGKWIAYSGYKDRKPAILIVSENGGTARVLSSGLAEVASSWSADGRSIYLLSTRSGQSEIWRVAVDADRAPERITQGGGSQAFESPDGRWLYFTTGADYSSVIRRALPAGPDTVLEKVGRVKKGFWAVSGAEIYRIFDNPEHIRGFVRIHPETGMRTEIPLAENGELLMSFSVNAAGEVVFDVNGRREEDLFAVDLLPRTIFRIGALRLGWPLWWR